jgi:CubicO group peptidase (beta-lactamase class C family)
VLPVAVLLASAIALDGGLEDLGPKVDRVFAELNRPDTPGCAVGVFHAGEIRYARGYGSANLDEGIPLGPQSVFNTASMTKQFTATAIILLAQEGKLSLDDDIRKYVPEVPELGRITLGELLHHTSGVRSVDELYFFEGFEDVRANEVLAAVSRQRALNFQPGTDWSYSNTGYWLLARVVSRVSGKPVPQFARERIFEPLGMRHTFFLGGRSGSVVPHRAIGYSRREDGGYDVGLDNGADDTGAGGIWTSIEDLALWDKNFYEPTVGGPPLIAALRKPGVLRDGTVLPYAAGLEVGSRCGQPKEGHGGDDGSGYHSILVRYPMARSSVAVACNFGPGRQYALAEDVAAVLLGPCPNEAPPAGAAIPSLATRSSDALGGRYVNGNTLEVRVLKAEGTRLFIGEPNAASRLTELFTTDGRTFVPKDGSVTYVVEPPSGKGPARLIRTTGRSRSTFFTAEPYRPDLHSLSEFAGRYATEEVQRDMEIVVQGGELFARPLGRLSGRRLLPIVQDGFVSGPFNETAFLFKRDSQHRITGLVIRSERVRQLEWKKRARVLAD